jgi:hypothetical protein
MVLLWAHAVIGQLFGDTGFVREIYANMKPIFPALAGSFASCISSYRKGTGNHTGFLETGKTCKFHI